MQRNNYNNHCNFWLKAWVYYTQLWSLIKKNIAYKYKHPQRTLFSIFSGFLIGLFFPENHLEKNSLYLNTKLNLFKLTLLQATDNILDEKNRKFKSMFLKNGGSLCCYNLSWVITESIIIIIVIFFIICLQCIFQICFACTLLHYKAKAENSYFLYLQSLANPTQVFQNMLLFGLFLLSMNLLISTCIDGNRVLAILIFNGSIFFGSAVFFALGQTPYYSHPSHFCNENKNAQELSKFRFYGSWYCEQWEINRESYKTQIDFSKETIFLYFMLATFVDLILFFMLDYLITYKKFCCNRKQIELNQVNRIQEDQDNENSYLQLKNIGYSYQYSKCCCKSKDPRYALKNIQLNIYKGCVTCLIGTNGSGKTTLLNILAGSILQYSGKMYLRTPDNNFQEFIPKKQAKDIGYCPQQGLIPPQLSLNQIFQIFYNIKMKDRSTKRQIIYKRQQICKRLQYQDNQKNFEDLHSIDKRKFILALALINEPKFLFIDEPLTGLDQQSRINFWATLNRLKAGRYIVVVTHDYNDSLSCADGFVCLNAGEKLKSWSSVDLQQNMKQFNQPQGSKPNPQFISTQEYIVQQIKKQISKRDVCSQEQQQVKRIQYLIDQDQDQDQEPCCYCCCQRFINIFVWRIKVFFWRNFIISLSFLIVAILIIPFFENSLQFLSIILAFQIETRKKKILLKIIISGVNILIYFSAIFLADLCILTIYNSLYLLALYIRATPFFFDNIPVVKPIVNEDLSIINHYYIILLLPLYQTACLSTTYFVSLLIKDTFFALGLFSIMISYVSYYLCEKSFWSIFFLPHSIGSQQMKRNFGIKYVTFQNSYVKYFTFSERIGIMVATTIIYFAIFILSICCKYRYHCKMTGKDRRRVAYDNYRQRSLLTCKVKHKLHETEYDVNLDRGQMKGFSRAIQNRDSTLFNLLLSFKNQQQYIINQGNDQPQLELLQQNIFKTKFKRYHQIGVCYSEKVFQSQLTVIEWLAFIGNNKSMYKNQMYRQIFQLLKLFKMSEQANKSIDKLSGGTIEKLGLIEAYLKSPKLILIESAPKGMDPFVFDKVKKINQKIVEQNQVGILVANNGVDQGQPEREFVQEFQNDLVHNQQRSIREFQQEIHKDLCSTQDAKEQIFQEDPIRTINCPSISDREITHRSDCSDNTYLYKSSLNQIGQYTQQSGRKIEKKQQSNFGSFFNVNEKKQRI